MPKIALAIICKNDEKEIELLNRCLDNVSPFVDGVFVTLTYKSGAQLIHEFDIKEKVNISHFEWVNDFSQARNFNFSQVPKDYDYILWCDADDMFRGLDKLKPTLEKNPQVDAFAFWYMYEFNDKKQPTVVHKKTQVIKNDGSFEWKGALHEDLIPNRQTETLFVEGIERMHFTTAERVEIARQRNVEVSKKEAQERPEDPRTLFNLGNSLIGAGQHEEARNSLEKFIETTGSDDEKYIAYMRLAICEDALGERDKAINWFRLAIGLKPEYSDAYLQLGYLFASYEDLDNAEQYLIMGLVKKPPYHEIIVYNPRDYDWIPLNTLAKVYFKKNRADLALPLLEGCLKITPDDEMENLVKEMRKEVAKLEAVITVVKELDSIEDKKEIKKALDKLPKDMKSHPAVCQIRNRHFVKTESSGKDITYYCGMTIHEWNPIMAKTKGIGGSEEAVINLSKQWAKQGYNVTVYANIGHEEIVDEGVVYKPFWEFNHRNKTDILVMWRQPKLADFDVNASKIYLDLHDVIGQGELTEKRLEKIEKIFVKTKFHRSLFPKVSDDKFSIIPNGMDFELFDQKIKKDQYLLVNTSSPDRSMDVLPKLFAEVKKQVPEARMKWCYGWEIFDNTFSDDKKMMEWRNKVSKEMDEAGIENLGRLSQKECAKLYLEGNILAYPTEFAEIDCITVKKAQACGCMPITTDFGALEESVQHGIKVHSPKTKDTWSREYKFAYGIEDEKVQKEWVDAVVKQLKTPLDERKEMKEWAKKFEWSKISSLWIKEF